MAKSYSDYLKEVLKSQEEVKESELQAIENKYQAEKDVKNKEYIDKIKKTDASYNDEISTENIKRLIEERKINEAIGNMGLLDSGLKKVRNSNLNHQLKSQMLQKNNIQERQRLQDEKDAKINDIEMEKLEKQAKTEESFLKDAENTAESLYKASIKGSGKTGNKKTSTNEKEKEPEFEYQDAMVHLDEKQLTNVAKFVRELNILDRQEYMNERRLDKTLPSYKDYVTEILKKARRKRKIDSKQYEFLLDYFNV